MLIAFTFDTYYYLYLYLYVFELQSYDVIINCYDFNCQIKNVAKKKVSASFNKYLLTTTYNRKVLILNLLSNK